MKILYIVPYTPTPIRTRPYNLLRNLARQGHQITLATVWENSVEQQQLEQFRESGIEVLAERLGRAQITQNLASALLNRKPLQSKYSWQPNLAIQIENKLSKYYPHCDIIQIEHLRGAVFGLYLLKKFSNRLPRQPILWDSVDNISALFQQAVQHSDQRFGRWITRFELPLTRRYEADLTGRFERILVTSPVDQEAFKTLADNSNHQTRIDVLSNGVDLEAFSPPDSPRLPNTIVFSGKLSYHANVSSANYLVEQVMPIVWARRPQVRVQLVGKDPHPSLISLAEQEPRVEVTGTVPDIRPYLQAASLTAATLTYGAGVQNKVLEAMACATPVVTTTRAVSALGVVAGQDVLVSDEPAGLAEHIVQLLEDQDYNHRIGENGLRYVRRNHDWNKIARDLTTIYEDIIHPS